MALDGEMIRKICSKNMAKNSPGRAVIEGLGKLSSGLTRDAAAAAADDDDDNDDDENYGDDDDDYGDDDDVLEKS